MGSTLLAEPPPSHWIHPKITFKDNDQLLHMESFMFQERRGTQSSIMISLPIGFYTESLVHIETSFLWSYSQRLCCIMGGEVLSFSLLQVVWWHTTVLDLTWNSLCLSLPSSNIFSLPCIDHVWTPVCVYVCGMYVCVSTCIQLKSPKPVYVLLHLYCRSVPGIYTP